MKADLELKQLRVFVTVVETGAHTRAAQALGISQSTVSETLSALERTLGTALFRKAAKGPLLTASGEALLPYARQMLALRSEIVSQVAKVSSDISTTLVVSAVESLSAYVLPAQLSALRDRWPNVRMNVIASPCTQIRESVAAGKSDLGLVVEAEAGLDDSSILAPARLTVFANSSHPLLKGSARIAVLPEKLGEYTFYMSDAAGDYHQVLRHYFETAELPVPRTESLGSVEGVKRGILTTKAALGLLPAYALEQELREGTLAEIRVMPTLPGIVIRAVVSQGSANSPVVADLIQAMRAWAQV